MYNYSSYRSDAFKILSGSLIIAIVTGIAPAGLFFATASAAESPQIAVTNPSNLIINPTLEVADPGDATLPQGWSMGAQWGTNVATYTYPVPVGEGTDIAGGSAVSVSFASYEGDVLTGGDGKWFPAYVPVTPGHSYLFQNAYRADVETALVAEFFNATHEHLSNAGFHSVPSTAADEWKIANALFIAPENAAFMTVYHQLASAGTLAMDNVTLTDTASASTDEFEHGFVSLAFDDGYVSQYTNARPILNAAGLHGTFYVVSHNNGFGVENPSFEIPDPTDPGRPLGWASIGNEDCDCNYPVSGRAGSAIQFIASTTPDSASGWRSQPVSILADKKYEFSYYYKSTAASNLYVEIQNVDGSVAYLDPTGELTAETVPYVELPAASDWTHYQSLGAWLVGGVESVSLRFAPAAPGTLEVDDVNIGAYYHFMTPEQLRELDGADHEIGAHSQTHVSLMSLPVDQAVEQITGSRQELLAGGISSVQSFAYPEGDDNVAIQTAVQSAGYTSARGTIPGNNVKSSNRFGLMSPMVLGETPMSEIEQLVSDAVADRSWLVLTFHQILPSTAVESSSPYTITPEKLQDIVNYLTANNVPVHTVSEGIALMESENLPAEDTTPPVIASHENITGAATASDGALISYSLPLVTDNRDLNLLATCTPASGTIFAVGTTTVTCTAQDASGNNAAPVSFSAVITLDSGTTTPVVPPVVPPPPAPSSGGGGGSIFIGSNSFVYWGCTNSTAINFNRLANSDDGSCAFVEGASISGLFSTTTEAVATSTVANTFSEVLGVSTTTASSTYIFKRYLRPGTRGEEVKELQQYLTNSGHFKGPITGYFGKLTYAAVKKFQAMSQITPIIGYVGPKTRAVLNATQNSWVITSINNNLSTVDNAATTTSSGTTVASAPL